MADTNNPRNAVSHPPVNSTDATGKKFFRKSRKKCATDRRRSLLPVKAAAKAASDEGENMNNTTTYIRYSEPTVRNNISQAYSQCMPEPDYGYSQQPNYGYSPEPQNASYYSEYAPMPQQPMPIQA